MRSLNLEGVFSSPYFILTQGVIFTSFAVFFGLDGFLLSVSTSFPLVFQVFQLISPYISERIGSRKTVAVVFNGFSRIAWPLFLLISVVLGIKRESAFVFWFALTQMTASVGNSSWMSWLRDLIPIDRRGKILGDRNFYVTLSSMLFVYVFSLLIERTGFGYLAVPCIALVFGSLSVIFVLKMEDVPLRRVGTLSALKKVLSDENFMRLTTFFFVWNAVIMGSAAFFNYHLIKNLKVPLDYIGIMSVISGITLMVFYKIYGRISDDLGHKTVAEIGVILVSLNAMMWGFMDEERWKGLLILDAILIGVGWSAVNLSFTTLPMEVASGTEQAYFSVYYALGGLGGFIGALIGGWIGGTIERTVLTVGDVRLHALQIFFFTFGMLRFSMLILLDRVRVKRYVPIRRMVYNYLAVSARRVSLRPVERSIGIVRSVLRRMRSDEGENGSGEGDGR